MHFTIILLIGLVTFRPGLIETALADSSPLPALIQRTRFIAYTPRSFSITGGKVVAAQAAGIRADLKLLRPFFNGLITYASANGVQTVPEIARDLAYRAVIMGIWDPSSVEEINNVISMAKRYPTIIAAVVVGNEGIYTKRYQKEDVDKTMHRIKQECPALPLSTSEPFFLYFKKDYADFFGNHDLLMPNVHPVFEKWFTPANPAQGVEMILQVSKKFSKTYNKPLLIKETGLPSGDERRGFSPKRQAQFWEELGERFRISPSQSLAYFEAFDAPWKPVDIATTFPGDHTAEAFWGVFTAEGKAKPVVDTLPRAEDF